MAIVAELLTVLKAESSQFTSGVNQAVASTERLQSSTDRMAAIGKVAFLALGTAAVATAVISVKAAEEYEVAHARLTAAVKASGQVWQEHAAQVEHADSKLRQLGFTDTDTEASLTKLVVATHNVGESSRLMSLAADIARGRHIDLASATDILVKVESGRVGMLGRLGIAVKDATGATISQQAALQKLTDLYGGQASSFADTFQGKLQVLEAQLDHIAVVIGEAVIPVLEGMISTGVAVLDFFQRNTELAIALGVVVGGPLVAAMLTYLYTVAATVATNIVAFWAGAAEAAGTLASGVLVLAGALDVAEVSALAFYAALALPVAAVVGLGVVLDNLTGGGGSFDTFVQGIQNADEAGKKFADSQAQIAAALPDAASGIDYLKGKVHDLRAEQDRIVTSFHQGVLSQEQAAVSYARTKGAIKELHADITKLRTEQEKQVAIAHVVAKTYGVEIPASYHLNSAEAKIMGTAIRDSAKDLDSFGFAATQLMLDAHLSGEAIEGTAKQAENFKKSIEGSIGTFTDVFSHFGTQAQVSLDDMTNFFVGSQQQAAAWADEITGLIQRGVDLGIIDNIARAGPGSKPALDAFVGMVDEHGVQWVNSVAASGNAAAQLTEQAYNRMAVAAAIKSAEIAAVSKAAFEDLLSGGTANLDALVGRGDADFQAMVAAARQQLPQIAHPYMEDTATATITESLRLATGVTANLNSIPKDTHVRVAVDTDTSNLDVLRAELAGITRSPFVVQVAVAAGAVPPGTYPGGV